MGIGTAIRLVVIAALVATGCFNRGGNDAGGGSGGNGGGGNGGAGTSGYAVPKARPTHPGTPSSRFTASTPSSTMMIPGREPTLIIDAAECSEPDCDTYCCPSDGTCIGGGQCEVPVTCSVDETECMYGGCCPANGTCLGGLAESVACEVPAPCGDGYTDCGDGTCCLAGEICSADDQCEASGCADGEVDCGDGTCCLANETCYGNSQRLCQEPCADLEIDCGDGTCCPMGTQCEDSVCVPEGGEPTPGGASGTGGVGGTSGTGGSGAVVTCTTAAHPDFASSSSVCGEVRRCDGCVVKLCTQVLLEGCCTGYVIEPAGALNEFYPCTGPMCAECDKGVADAFRACGC